MEKWKAGMIVVFAGVSVGLCGCGLFPEEAQIDDTIRVEHYVPVQHTMVKVQKGDLDESYITAASYQYTEQKDYYLQYAGAENKWGLEIHNYVVTGDLVKQGQLLAEAPCQDLEQQLSDYQSQAQEIQAAISYHQKLLKEANEEEEKQSCREAIRESKSQLEVVNARISETNAKIADYRIYADMDGQVMWLADAEFTGNYTSSDPYITLASLDGVFSGTMDVAKCNLQVGDTFSAMIEDTPAEVTVASVEEGEDDKVNVTYTTEKKYANNTKAQIQIVGEKRDNVLYLPAEAVKLDEDKAYVTIIGEDGYPRVKEITVSGPVSGSYIIESGLEEGDEVVNE